jgi:arginine repressor
LREDRELERRELAAMDKMLAECEPLPVHEKLMKISQWMGLPVLTSTASRDPKEEETARSEGRGPDASRAETAEESPFRNGQDLIGTATTIGTYGIFIKTRKGAGLKGAAAIDGSHWEELAGTIAGNNSVMLLTESQSSQDLLMDRLKLFADRYRKPRGGAGVSGALPGG